MIYRDVIQHAVDAYGDRVAVVCKKESGLTHLDIDRSSNALCARFRDDGLEKGDRIALYMGNCHHYREMFWTAGKGGFVLTPINGRLKPREILHIVNDSEARALVVARGFEAVVEEIRPELRHVRRYYSVDPGVEGHAYLGGSAAEYSADPPEVGLSGDDLLWFQYTSGTTGLPKAAMLTQGIAGAIIEICDAAIKDKVHFDENTRALQLLPSYSFSGAAYDILYQWIGAKTVIMESFDASKMMALIEEHRITDCHIVPVVLKLLLESPDFGRYDLGSLVCITYGAAPMPPPLLREGIEKIGPVFMQDYGASEAGALTILDIQDHVVDGPPEKVRRLASCGRPIPGAGVKVLNERGEEVEPGEIGELTTRSPMVMKGYWNMPEETAASLKDGRFYTGDLCTVDEEGYIYVKDRKKDMIISGGFNVYPFELESVLLEHPAIADAAVFGIPDEKWGEAICAHVVLHPGREATEEEIVEFVKGNLASYKKPKKVEFVSSIPRTLSGKILKRELRAKYWEGRDRKV